MLSPMLFMFVIPPKPSPIPLLFLLGVNSICCYIFLESYSSCICYSYCYSCYSICVLIPPGYYCKLVQPWLFILGVLMGEIYCWGCWCCYCECDWEIWFESVIYTEKIESLWWLGFALLLAVVFVRVPKDGSFVLLWDFSYFSCSYYPWQIIKSSLGEGS